ncbi:MAG: hypothetical protein ACI398_08485, partial [Clostridium sp.]
AIGDMGHLVGRGALLSTTLVLGLLPILLIWTDKIILRRKKFSIKNIKKNFSGFKEKSRSENENAKIEVDENKAAIRKDEGNVKKE